MSDTGRIAPRDWMLAPATRSVMAALGKTGAAPRFVGGCVRDALAERPVKDIDIATPLSPEEVLARLKAAGIKSVPTGIAHGTVTAIVEHTPFEITTLRVDVETDGRHAKVAFTDDWVADAARRDLTINALSCEMDGTLHDPFGGAEDLRAGRIRFVGEARARLREDYLRLLRYFRFQAHFGRAAPDAETLAVIAEEAPNLRQLSGERVREEILKLLAAPDPLPAIETMIARSILAEVLPGAFDPAVLGASLRAGVADPLHRLAALIEPDRETARQAAERLRLSNKQAKALGALADSARGLSAGLTPHKRWRAHVDIGPELIGAAVRLDWARRHAGGELVGGPALSQAVNEAEALAAKTLPLRGADALKLGMKAGPELGGMLAAVEVWWAEGGFKATRAQCREYMKARL